MRASGKCLMKAKPTKPFDERDHQQLALWAADCAEHVLHYFEETHPDDDRPRKAIEAARAWARGELRMMDARKAAFATHAAARIAGNSAAQMAARAAGHAAGTAHMAATRSMQPRTRSKRLSWLQRLMP